MLQLNCLNSLQKYVYTQQEIKASKTPKIAVMAQKKYKKQKHKNTNIIQKTPKKNHKIPKVLVTPNNNSSEVLNVFTVNANGMKQKVESLKNLVKQLKIGVFTLQETRYLKRGNIKVDGFEIFEAFRKKKGGGTLIGVQNSLKPILIQEYSDEFELLVVEIAVEKTKICVISGYEPQETWTLDQNMPFFAALEEEVTKAELAGRSVIISFDANSKLGPMYIKGDPHAMSENGKILEGIIDRHALCVANGITDKSKGTITRERITKDSEEKSVIDFVLISSDLAESMEKIVIDEQKEFALENISKNRKGVVIKKSDHNSIISTFKLKWNTEVKKPRIEHFNLKDPEGQKKFKEMTSSNILTSLVDKDTNVNKLTKKFIKRLNGIIHQCLKKD